MMSKPISAAALVELESAITMRPSFRVTLQQGPSMYVCVYVSERKRKRPGVKHQHLLVTLYVSSNSFLSLSAH